MNEVICADHIRESLYCLLREYGRAYVLVDRFDGDPLNRDLALPAGSRPEVLPLVDRIFQETPERSPALIALDHDNPNHLEILDQTVLMACKQVRGTVEPRSLCAWLSSRVDPGRIVRDMSRRLTARYANGTNIYLRYFDPRVTPRLTQLLASHAAESLFAPIEVWCQLGRDGSFLRHEGAPTTTGFAASGLRFDAATSSAVDRIEQINQVASTLARNGTRPGHEHDARIDAALVDAVGRGIERSEDQISYSAHAVQSGDSFTGLASVAVCIERARRTGAPLEDLLSQSLPGAALQSSNAAARLGS